MGAAPALPAAASPTKVAPGPAASGACVYMPTGRARAHRTAEAVAAAVPGACPKLLELWTTVLGQARERTGRAPRPRRERARGTGTSHPSVARCVMRRRRGSSGARRRVVRQKTDSLKNETYNSSLITQQLIP